MGTKCVWYLTDRSTTPPSSPHTHCVILTQIYNKTSDLQQTVSVCEGWHFIRPKTGTRATRMDTIGSAEVHLNQLNLKILHTRTNIGLHVHTHTPFPQGYKIKRSVWLTASPSFPRTLSIPSLPPACSAPRPCSASQGGGHTWTWHRSDWAFLSTTHTHMHNHTCHNSQYLYKMSGGRTENTTQNAAGTMMSDWQNTNVGTFTLVNRIFQRIFFIWNHL